MKRLFTAFFAALVLAGCGGGGDDAIAPRALAQLGQCNGTPKAAIVYAGVFAYPELASLANACVYTTDTAAPEVLKDVVDRATAAAGTERVYLVGTDAGAALALGYMFANPGHTDTPSLWFTPFAAPPAGVFKGIISVHLNDVDAAACARQAAVLPEYVPPVCTTWPSAVFGPEQRAAAIAQLHLELLQ